MYLPPQFEGDRTQAAALIQDHPFASLISVDDAGLPYVTHLPLHLEERAQAGSDLSQFVLLGHVAKPNRHWRYLQARSQAVVTFLGPHAYLSPSVYPDLARVPTWNYLAVHCTVQATLIDEPAAKDCLLKKLIGDHELAYADQWRGLDQVFAHKMLAGIVAFELLVTDLQCKLKLNQHRPEAHVRMKAMYAAGNENEQAMASWMDRLGMGAGPTNPQES
ncbi:MAG: FMN-binding negative transcriptional regulator [Polaromonas sp.]